MTKLPGQTAKLANWQAGKCSWFWFGARTMASAPAITLSRVHYVSANMPGISYGRPPFFRPSCCRPRTQLPFPPFLCALHNQIWHFISPATITRLSSTSSTPYFFVCGFEEGDGEKKVKLNADKYQIEGSLFGGGWHCSPLHTRSLALARYLL